MHLPADRMHAVDLTVFRVTLLQEEKAQQVRFKTTLRSKFTS